MIKSLENVDITKERDLKKAKSYELRGIALKGDNFAKKFNSNSFDVFMCDCDQWGGEPAPCDDCR